jgi:hypothetical protein
MTGDEATDRLAVMRGPELDAPRGERREPRDVDNEPAEIEWEGAPDTDELTTHVCHELSRGENDVCYLGLYDSLFDGSHQTFIRVSTDPIWIARIRELMRSKQTFEGPLGPAFERYMDIGTGRGGTAVLNYYSYGTSLAALRDAGVALSWSTACCLHAAATHPLRELHATGRAHGALTARRVRLSLFSEHNGTGANPPIRYVASLGTAITDEVRRAELRLVAETIGAMTRHPDDAVERLLRDPAARDVLRDLVLERGTPVDHLLADQLDVDVPAADCDDVPIIDRELDALWDRVASLEPLIQRFEDE